MSAMQASVVVGNKSNNNINMIIYNETTAKETCMHAYIYLKTMQANNSHFPQRQKMG